MNIIVGLLKLSFPTDVWHLNSPKINSMPSHLNDQLDISMTAKEMREKLKKGRWKDPRREDKGDIRRRFQIINYTFLIE